MRCTTYVQTILSLPTLVLFTASTAITTSPFSFKPFNLACSNNNHMPTTTVLLCKESDYTLQNLVNMF